MLQRLHERRKNTAGAEPTLPDFASTSALFARTMSAGVVARSVAILRRRNHEVTEPYEAQALDGDATVVTVA